MDELREARERAGPIEALASPRGGEITPLRQLQSCAAQSLERGVLVCLSHPRQAARPTERTPDTLGRVLETFFEPAGKRLIEETLGLPLGEHAEQRVDPCFDGTLAEQVGAEPVNGADVRLLEVLDGVLETRCGGGIARRAALLVQPLPQAKLQLARGLLGERHGNDLVHARAPGREHQENPVHELGCLARTRRRLDHERFIERFGNEPAVRLVQVSSDRVHGLPLRACRSASESCGLRETRRKT